MTKLDLVCLGEPLVEFNQLPDQSFKRSFGGDVSNVAIAAARQGAKCGLITKVGRDIFGDSLCELWAKEGVDTSGVLCIADGETGIYFVTHDENGHHFAYRRKNSAASTLSADDLRISQIDSSKIYYASGISLAVSRSMGEATIAAAEIARQSGNLFAFDPNLRTALWSLDEAKDVTNETMRCCDIALPGLDDARQLTGLEGAEEIVDFYHDLGAGIVALTLGKHGALLSVNGEKTHLNGHDVNSVDATGAGDCFNGVFLATFAATKDWTKAAKNANAAAALSTTSFGAIGSIPYKMEVDAFLMRLE